MWMARAKMASASRIRNSYVVVVVELVVRVTYVVGRQV